MRLALVVVLSLLAPLPAASEPRAGEFDYYVLALSWSPTWCALTGEARGAPQCAATAGHGWVLHGLWPQYRRGGWPEYCRTPHEPPTRAMQRDMADIMGSTTLARHQWIKHGTCTGLSAAEYQALARSAYRQVTRPGTFRDLTSPMRMPADAVAQAFLDANPGWAPDMLTITCREGRIQEARLCLTRDLVPVACGDDVLKQCRWPKVLVAPIR